MSRPTCQSLQSLSQRQSGRERGAAHCAARLNGYNRKLVDSVVEVGKELSKVDFLRPLLAPWWKIWNFKRILLQIAFFDTLLACCLYCRIFSRSNSTRKASSSSEMADKDHIGRSSLQLKSSSLDVLPTRLLIRSQERI